MLNPSNAEATFVISKRIYRDFGKIQFSQAIRQPSYKAPLGLIRHQFSDLIILFEVHTGLKIMSFYIFHRKTTFADLISPK